MIPNADRAQIDPEKLRSYLLSPTHPVGRFKAAILKGPNGQAASVRSVWFIPTGGDVPRFVTAYPGDDK